MFWNAVAQRGDAGRACARRSSASGASWTWTRGRRRRARDRHGPGRRWASSPARRASILANTVGRVGAAPTWPSCAPAACRNGIYPTDAAGAGRSTCARTRARAVLFVEDDEQLDKALEVRAQLPLLRKIVVFDMEGLRDFDDPQVIEPGRAARARAATIDAAHPRRAASSASPRASPTTWRSWSTPRAPPASPRARCISHRSVWSLGARLQHADRRRTRATSACASCRCATSPSAWAARTSRCTPARCSTSSRTPRPCPRTCARSRPPCSSPCRASGRSSIRP